MEERQAFIEKLYVEHADFLAQLCRKRTGYTPYCKDMIDDCVQETFLKALASYDLLLRHENVRGWLALTCIHCLQYAFRQEKRQQRIMVALLRERITAENSGSNPVEEQQERRETCEDLQLLLSQLSPRERIILVDYFYHQQTMKMVAISQRMTENQVKSVIRRIRRKANAFFYYCFYLMF